jgi:hypothetical protein
VLHVRGDLENRAGPERAGLVAIDLGLDGAFQDKDQLVRAVRVPLDRSVRGIST